MTTEASTSDRPVIRAVQYVRMSTEHQQYSIENQADVIQRYADANGVSLVRSYCDDGKSGLVLSGRTGLQELLQQVQTGKADFDVILVYDVSRWGLCLQRMLITRPERRSETRANVIEELRNLHWQEIDP